MLDEEGPGRPRRLHLHPGSTITEGMTPFCCMPGNVIVCMYTSILDRQTDPSYNSKFCIYLSKLKFKKQNYE